MVTRNIKCMGCEFEGKVEAPDTVGLLSTDKIFKLLGKDPNTGYILLRCPSCGENLEVDPLKSFLRRKMEGLPVNSQLKKSEDKLKGDFIMDVKREKLRKRYEALNDEALIELHREGGFTEDASEVLGEELLKRGLSENI